MSQKSNPFIGGTAFQNAHTYIGVKQVTAVFATRGEAAQFKGEEVPENADDHGMLIKYQDNHVSWSPLDVFDEAYRCVSDFSMNFGLAVEAMKRGEKLARKGWNGKNMYCVMMPGYPDGIPCNEATSKQHGIPRGQYIMFRPYFQLRAADGSFVVFNPNTSDILADDWYVLNDRIEDKATAKVAKEV